MQKSDFNTDYKVKVNSKHGLRDPRGSCRLQISMLAEKQTGEKFYTLCEWASKRFDEFTVIVSDTLQRYNISHLENCSIEEAHPLSIELGNKWIEDNYDALSLLPNLKITRWDDWLNHEGFAKNHQEIIYMYDHSREFRRAVNIKIYNIWHKWNERASEDYPSHKKAKFFSSSLNLILEELALFPIMFEKEAVDIYAGTWFYDLFQTLMPIVSLNMKQALQSASCYEVDFSKRKAA